MVLRVARDSTDALVETKTAAEKAGGYADCSAQGETIPDVIVVVYIMI